MGYPSNMFVEKSSNRDRTAENARFPQRYQEAAPGEALG